MSKIKYPVKIGYKDGSGQTEFVITDANDVSLVAGQGDCCMVGGIQDVAVAIAIIDSLNKVKPKIEIS